MDTIENFLMENNLIDIELHTYNERVIASINKIIVGEINEPLCDITYSYAAIYYDRVIKDYNNAEKYYMISI